MKAIHRIGTENESTLHSQLKEWYFKKGDAVESDVDGYIIDLVRGSLLVEFQTSNLSALKKKFRALLPLHNIRLVYPVIKQRWIVKLHPDRDEILYRRKSPKKGKFIDMFDELVYLHPIAGHENFSLEVLLINEEQVRRDDGKGSWRRKGVSIIDHRLLGIEETCLFCDSRDFLSFLPRELPEHFTNRELSDMAGCPIYRAAQLTYFLKKLKVIEQVGKKGNAHLFAISSD